MDSATQIPIATPSEAPAAVDTSAVNETGITASTETAETPAATETPAESPAEGKETESEGDDKPVEGAPEEYADFSMPENMVVDESALEKFKPLAKELNLNQEQAQKLIDIAAEMTAGHYTKQVEEWQNTQSEWQKAAKADKEYGGDKFDENAEAARRVINTFGTPELKQFLTDYGLGNHPEAVRLFVRISKSLKEDTLVVSGNKTAPKGNIANRMYPNLPN